MKQLHHLKDNKQRRKQQNFHTFCFVGLQGDRPFDRGLPEGRLRTGETAGKFKMTQQPVMKCT
jgi:hypothetical protein